MQFTFHILHIVPFPYLIEFLVGCFYYLLTIFTKRSFLSVYKFLNMLKDNMTFLGDILLVNASLTHLYHLS